MTEPGGAVAEGLGMSIVEYSVQYKRGITKAPESSVQVFMSVEGATVEHHHKPISRVDIVFLEGEFEANRVGFLDADPTLPEITLHANLPLADFAGFWAALRLDSDARLDCLIQRDDVLELALWSKVSLLPV